MGKNESAISSDGINRLRSICHTSSAKFSFIENVFSFSLTAYGNLANVLTQQGRLKEAETALKVALEHRPNMADSHYNL